MEISKKVIIVLTVVALGLLSLPVTSRAQAAIPVVDLGSDVWSFSHTAGCLLGGKLGQRWLKPGEIAPLLPGGETYRLYTLTRFVGTAQGSKPEKTEDPGVPEYIVQIESLPVHKDILAIGGPWNALPRTDTDNPKAGNLSQQPSKASIWKAYRNDQYGFSFEYPAVYDEEANHENCGIHTSTDRLDSRLGQIRLEIQLGLRIYLDVLDAPGSSLRGYVNRFIKEREGADWILQAKQNISVQGLKGQKIEYRFGGLGRYGSVAFLKRNGSIFLFNFSAGANCDFPEKGITEFEAYKHMLKTFKFHRCGAVNRQPDQRAAAKG